MRKKKFFFINILLFFLIILNNCTKGPIVTDIVKGIYDNRDRDKSIKSKKIKIFTGDTLKSLSKKYGVTNKELIRFKPNNIAIIDSLWNFKQGPVQSALKFKENLEVS